MRRPLLWLGVAVLAAAGFASAMALAGEAGTDAKATVKAAYNPTLKKTVLVTSSGLTLYRNKTESKGRVRCGNGCASAWPPLLVRAGTRPTAGKGVPQTKLATIRRPDGHVQVTFGGMPLYRFAGDKLPGEAKGQGLGGIWFAVATGAPPPATTGATTTSPTDSTGATTTEPPPY